MEQDQNNQSSNIEKETVFSLSQDDLDKAISEAVQKVKSTRHGWRQKGPYIYCKSCDYEHGVFVGIEKVLIGMDSDGNPKFK